MHRLDPNQQKALKNVSHGCGVVSISAGCCVLVGWILNIHFLKVVLPYQVEVRANSGLSFILLGLALILAPAKDDKFVKVRQFIYRALTAITLIIGVGTLIEYACNFDLGIDKWIGSVPADSNQLTHWGRISIPASICIVLLSIGLFLIQTKNNRLMLWLQGLVLLVVATSFFAYVYDISLLTSFHRNTIPISSLTAFVCGTLAIGIVLKSGSVMSIRLESITRPAFFSSIFVLIALAIAFAQNGFLTTQNSHSVLRSTKIMDDLDSIHAQLVSARMELDTSIRSRAGIPWQHYSKYTNAVDGYLDDLSQKIESVQDPQFNRLKSLRSWAEKTFGPIEVALNTNHQGDLPSINASDIELVSRLLTAINTLDALVLEMTRAEEDSMSAHQDLIVQSTYRTITGAAIGSLLSLAILIVLFVRLNREVKQQRETSAEIILAKEEADRSNQTKGLFLSKMSHELRTPLNAVIGFAQLVKMQSIDPQVTQSADMILKGGNHLLFLVNDILDIAKIEAGKLAVSIESVEINEAIRHAMDLVGQIASEYQIHLEFECQCRDSHAYADRHRVIQVLLNLITNAIKYNRPNGKVIIRCRETQDGMIAITIEDTGKGFEAKHIQHMFEPFERGGNHTVSGTGLGLAVSAGLMKLMGGSIDLSHTSSEGSKFELLLKATAPPSELKPTQELLSMDAPKLTHESVCVLYIEDNPSNIELIEKVAQMIGGFELITAKSGLEGLVLIELHKLDLVLLDLHLPDIDGVDVLRQIQSNPETHELPVVILSADATQNQIDRMLALGANEYLTKPIDIAKLMSIINSAVAKRR